MCACADRSGGRINNCIRFLLYQFGALLKAAGILMLSLAMPPHWAHRRRPPPGVVVSLSSPVFFALAAYILPVSVLVVVVRVCVTHGSCCVGPSAIETMVICTFGRRGESASHHPGAAHHTSDF